MTREKFNNMLYNEGPQFVTSCVLFEILEMLRSEDGKEWKTSKEMGFYDPKASDKPGIVSKLTQQKGVSALTQDKPTVTITFNEFQRQYKRVFGGTKEKMTDIGLELAQALGFPEEKE